MKLSVEPVSPGQVNRLRYVLQYYRTSQLAMRFVTHLRRRWLQWTGAKRLQNDYGTVLLLRDNRNLDSVLNWKTASRRARGSADRAQEILRGCYCFLNQKLTLPDPLDWRLNEHPGTPLLWRFQFHCQEFLLDLAAEASEQHPEYLQRIHELIRSWIVQNHSGGPIRVHDAWHPYCISRRLPVWMLLCTRLPELKADPTVLSSIASQARFLERHLEWDLRGNHLLENLKAMAIAGAFFAGRDADRWLKVSHRLLEFQIQEQILHAGEHFERSPMYHAIMLEGFLDVRDATRDVCPNLADRCDEAARRMARFVEAILHPDGDIPLFGDSCLNATSPIHQLLERAGERNVSISPAGLDPTRHRAQLIGDYWVFRSRKDCVILDAGPVGPDELPAHAHSDLLSWEGSIGGKRLIVDSGTFHYQDDEMRHYCRSTPAHNVLQIDDRPLCDTWSSFRLGYRGWPGRPVTGQAGDFTWVCASHNACRRSGVPSVGRLMACRPGGPWICVDWARGKGTHRLTNWLHFHPDAKIIGVDSDCVSISWNGHPVHVSPLTDGNLQLLEGWYCPEFGLRLPHPVLQWTRKQTLPAVCGWQIMWRSPFGRAVLKSGGLEPVVEWTDDEGSVGFSPFGPLEKASMSWRDRMRNGLS